LLKIGAGFGIGRRYVEKNAEIWLREVVFSMPFLFIISELTAASNCVERRRGGQRQNRLGAPEWLKKNNSNPQR
jgi:hypothetical protein